MNLLELKQQRADSVDQLELILKNAVDASGKPRDLTEAENALFEKCQKQIEEFDVMIGIENRRMAVKAANAVPHFTNPADMPWTGEKRQYSLGNAVQKLMNGQTPDGYEAEIHQELVAKGGTRQGGFCVPFSALVTKTQVAGTAADGGFLVPDVARPDLLIDVLRPESKLLGMVSSIQAGFGAGALLIPKITDGSDAYWIPENREITESGLTFGQLQATPRMLAGRVTYSRVLAVTSSPSFEQLLAGDLRKALADKLDRTILQGSGVSEEPQGLLNNPSVLTENSSSGDPDYATSVKMLTKIHSENITSGLAWLHSHGSYGKWLSQLDGDDRPMGNEILGLGLPVTVSGNMPATTMVLGRWSDILLCTWGNGVELLVDPFTQGSKALITIRLLTFADVVIRRPEAFCKVSDIS